MNASEKTGASADRAAVAFHPPILLAVCIGGGFMERWLFPFPVVPDALALPIGGPIVVVSLALFAWAVLTMRSRGASIPTTTGTDVIVSAGPYRYSRNPIYLAMMLLLTGLGFWANAVWFFAWMILAVVLLTFYVIRPEERYLEEKFGETYLSYKRKTRRWV